MSEPNIEDIKIVIDALTLCEKEGRHCKKCKAYKKEDCLIFIRDSVAVALQFIYNDLKLKEKKEPSDYFV